MVLKPFGRTPFPPRLGFDGINARRRHNHFTIVTWLITFGVANTALPQQQTLAELKAAALRPKAENLKS
jgi:hypothetical protein